MKGTMFIRIIFIEIVAILAIIILVIIGFTCYLFPINILILFYKIKKACPHIGQAFLI